MTVVGDRQSAFVENLRLLCERQGSISAICRKIDMNRQQFNKYLSGLHTPSQQNLRIIANHFGLNVSILFADPEEFRTLLDGNFFTTMSKLRSLPEFSHFVSNMIVSNDLDVSTLLGVYDRYQYSSIYRGFILRSAICFYRNNDFTQHYYIERFPSYDSPGTTEYVFKYHGFCFPISDRIFTIDYESIQNNELTFGVYAQVRRNAKRFMFGITSGIAATMFRQPYSTKVALHYRGPGLLGREQLKDLTVMDRNDPSIPQEARHYLGDGSDMIHMD